MARLGYFWQIWETNVGLFWKAPFLVWTALATFEAIRATFHSRIWSHWSHQALNRLNSYNFKRLKHGKMSFYWHTFLCIEKTLDLIKNSAKWLFQFSVTDLEPLFIIKLLFQQCLEWNVWAHYLFRSLFDGSPLHYTTCTQRYPHTHSLYHSLTGKRLSLSLTHALQSRCET